MLSRPRTLLLTFAASACLTATAGVAYAAFSATTASSSNVFTANPDWVPPTGTSVIMRSGGSVPGWIHQGGTYYAYANATDTGNPASGVKTATADLSVITAGATLNSLVTTGGPWTVAGTSYAYRSSAVVTARAALTGTPAYTMTLADNATPTNSQTLSGFSVTLDNTAPSATGIETADHGGTIGKAQATDTMTLTFSTTQMEPATVLAGWSGASTSVTATITNSSSNDLFTVNGTNLGTVQLTGNYVFGTRTFTGSTMVMVGATIVITLGTPSGSTITVSGTSAMVWTPLAAMTDYAGNAMSTTARTEAGGADAQF